MKLTRQIITMSTFAFIALGLAFILISSIAIGSQASVASDRRALKIQYNEDVLQTTRSHDIIIEGIEDIKVTDLYTQDDKKEDLEDAKQDKEDALRDLENNYKIQKSMLRDQWADNLRDAFVYDRLSHTVDVGNNATTVGTDMESTLTPMGAIMISGLAFTTIGLAVLFAIKFIDKKESPKKESKKDA